MGTKGRVAIAFAAAVGTSAFLLGEALAAPTVTLGSDPAATLKGAVRYRNFGSGGGAEIQVGASDGSGGITSPATGDVTWGSPISKAVTFSYNPVTGNLTGTVAGSTPASIVKNVGNFGALDYLEIKITKNTPTTSVALSSVLLGSDNLGNFQLTGAGATTKWMVTGIDLQTGFTLSGNVMVTGLSGSGDSSFVQIDVGSVPPSDSEGPVASSVIITPNPVIINGDATVSANINDSTTGGNTIGSAEYSLDGGSAALMDAQDGTFDEVSEDVEATFTATEIGENEVCVWGTDSLGNAGDEICQLFSVWYDFAGFSSPIDNNLVNGAKAGQAVPAKWRLMDFNGDPITDSATFVNLLSYQVNCETYQGNPLDAVEEYASGSSGLQNLGDGYFQFNWKTPKTYADKCYAMYVEFNSGQTSPVVLFKFKR